MAAAWLCCGCGCSAVTGTGSTQMLLESGREQSHSYVLRALVA